MEVIAEQMKWKQHLPTLEDVAVGCRSVCMISIHSFRFPTTTTSVSVLNVGLLLLLLWDMWDICHSQCVWYSVWATAGCQGWLSAAGNWADTYILKGWIQSPTQAWAPCKNMEGRWWFLGFEKTRNWSSTSRSTSPDTFCPNMTWNCWLLIILCSLGHYSTMNFVYRDMNILPSYPSY